MRKYVCYDVFVGDTCNVEEFGNYRDALAYYKKQLAKNKDNKTIWIAGWKDTGGQGAKLATITAEIRCRSTENVGYPLSIWRDFRGIQRFNLKRWAYTT